MDLNNLFTNHTCSTGQQERMRAIRAKALDFARQIADLVPASREQSLAITSLQQAMMWANAGIACNE
jgi:hypothetical protein